MPDPQRLRLLVEEIDRQGGTKDYSAPQPIVSLDLFFEGNDDESSICPNIMDSEREAVGGISGIYALFKKIKQIDGVQDVLVPIYGYEEDAGWPDTDSVIVICKHNMEEVEKWVEVIRPSEITDITSEWPSGYAAGAPPIRKGMKAYHLWWD